MSLSSFHPVVSRWFTDTLGSPTRAQQLGWTTIRERRHTLIAAPTGSGKTLAAFLTALDELVRESTETPLPDEVRVVYVSPLKALSADIHKNLAEPRDGIHRLAAAEGMAPPQITAAVRTGDTTPSERAAMLRTPPHILVTTPESLYLLLTAGRSREMLRTVRTVIVDEIHAVIGTRRGAHLALSLERLQQVADRPLLRIGLSATQKPIEEVARFLVGVQSPADGPRAGHGGQESGHACIAGDCAIVDEGHRRMMDLGLEIPRSPLEAVMSHEVWEEYFDRLTALVAEHRTTLIFVNTRRMAERVARCLSDRLGEDAVTAHHGSLSKERRLDAECRLKSGALKALVATASLELGIDIGTVDLVCQMGSPHRIATLLQRVGRSGHTITGTPKGRLFPSSRDDLIECAALMRSVHRGELDRIISHDAPRDVLAQQIVAETACCDYAEDDLFALVRRAWPYRDLPRDTFDAVLAMTAEGFATRRGRRSALVHRDEVNRRVRARRGSRLLAISSGGAIPEVADYRVILDPSDTFIGTLNEDFAIESNAGDIFQLGNASWMIQQVASGVVRVSDAKGAPPTIPFWLGEAPARSDELSRAVSDLRRDVDVRLRPDTTADADGLRADPTAATVPLTPAASDVPGVAGFSRTACDWLAAETGVPIAAAEQAIAYLADGRAVLGVLPTQETIVLERFFDESGGMQLVLHAPFGSRITKAWSLALRKRFCRQFNFELQAAATEDGLLLSLGPQHSFPLADVFRYLHPATAKDILVQAFLDAPVFQTRWRWNATISLAVPRNRGGRKVPPPLQRMLADDLMAACFPDAAACLENIPGDRQIPDHPLVAQTVRDCLEEAMDFDGLSQVLARIHAGNITCVARDTTEPSPLCHELLNARPYSFMDDAPLEERRTQAVYTRRATEPSHAGELGALDAGAIERVRDEARPDPRDADELHDALMITGFLTRAEASASAPELASQLIAARRAAEFRVPNSDCQILVAAERLPEVHVIHGDGVLTPPIEAPPSRTARAWTREEAIVELLRGRLTVVGPTTAAELAGSLAVSEADADQALLALEADGVAMRGHFSTGGRESFRSDPKNDSRPPVENWRPLEWCDRRLLARIHRYTLHRLRAEIEPVSPADFMRFLFAWQHVDPIARLAGVDGLRSVLDALDGYEIAADAWERAVLPARVEGYDGSMLDTLSLTGEIAWARLSTPDEATQIVGATPVALFLREHGDAWAVLKGCAAGSASAAADVPPASARVLDVLRARGALFVPEIAAVSGATDAEVRSALAELVARGLVTSDGFGGLRAIIRTATGRPLPAGARTNVTGRWSIIDPRRAESAPGGREAAVELQARTLLRRYGIVFRRLLAREPNAAPWRELARVYRRLEARGEIRGGRFVTAMSGEQFALPEAVERVREIRRTHANGRLHVISAADPLNLAGIVTTGDRVRAVAANRIVYRDGVPIAAMEGDYVRPLIENTDAATASAVTMSLTGRAGPAVVSGFLGRP
ncbi:MAG TPA: DEAD/DEAH box helicase [Vicinamibacterales bacterium]|nr:DEAD/DEAH box helicase [Vicinamibacterales bacterium]